LKSASARTRRRSRESALQILYQWEIGQNDLERAIETFFTLQWPDPGEVPAAIRDFATALARETVAQLPTIDPLIAESAERWRPERMAVIDRLILRMAVCELRREVAEPPAVIINEALELARTFSTEDSVRFVNGMLDGILKRTKA
jgi:N utilization substance protein B